VLIVTTIGPTQPWIYAAAWGATGTLAGLVTALRTGWRPVLGGAASWTWSHRRTSRYLFLEIASAYGSVQFAIVLVSVVSGPAAAGAFRGVQTLLGPVNVVGMAATAFIFPGLVRRPTLTRRARLAIAAAFSLALAIANLLYGIVLLNLPFAVGAAILGETWVYSEAVILPFIIWAAAVGLSLGPLAVLQSNGHARAAALCSVALVPLVLLGTAIGIHLDGFRGTAFGIMSAQAAILIAWWAALWAAAHDDKHLVSQNL